MIWTHKELPDREMVAPSHDDDGTYSNRCMHAWAKHGINHPDEALRINHTTATRSDNPTQFPCAVEGFPSAIEIAMEEYRSSCTPRPWSSAKDKNGKGISRQPLHSGSPAESIAVTGQSDIYIINLTRPAPPQELRTVHKRPNPSARVSQIVTPSDLPSGFNGYRHSLSPRPEIPKVDKPVTQAPSATQTISRRSPKKLPLQPKSRRPNAECTAMLKLKKQLQDEIAKTSSLKAILGDREKKIQELQKTILIERQQNKELTIMLERRSQTDDLADCYLNELLLSRYQSHCNNERQ